jgi:hypothetical protein
MLDLPLAGRAGGVYIPPFKLARMMQDVQDRASPEYQRLTWEVCRCWVVLKARNAALCHQHHAVEGSHWVSNLPTATCAGLEEEHQWYHQQGQCTEHQEYPGRGVS